MNEAESLIFMGDGLVFALGVTFIIVPGIFLGFWCLGMWWHHRFLPWVSRNNKEVRT